MSLVICITGTRRHSEKLERVVRSTLEQHIESCVYLFHGSATGADSIAASYGVKRAWQVIALPYPKFAGKEGGPVRNLALAACAAQWAAGMNLKRIGYAFPDSKSRGTWSGRSAFERFHIPTTVIRV